MRFLILALLLTGCFGHHDEKSSPGFKRDQLLVKYSDTKAALAAISDRDTGWPSVNDCDGTLWAGIACAGGAPVKIELAEYSPGEIHRRPAPSCWNKDKGDIGAKSTVSNDMLIGYMWCLWAKQDISAFQRLAEYGEGHSWVMGEPAEEVGAVVLKPNEIGLLGRALFKLSEGHDDRIYRHTIREYVPVTADYERHIQALGIALQGEVTEGGANLIEVSEQMLKRINDLVDAEPENALYQTIRGVYSGDMSKAVDLLLRDDVIVPTYFRGDNPAAYVHAEWLLAAKIALKRMEK